MTYLWDSSAAFMVLLLPLLVFLRFNDYSLLRREVAVCCLLVAAAALVWGVLMGLGQFMRVAVFTFLLVLLVDVQTDWITTVGLRLLLCVVGFGLACLLLRKHLTRVVLVLFAAMILATLLQPSGQMRRHWGDVAAETVGNQPFVLHVIVDGFAAPEAIDRDFDQDGAIAAEISSIFIDHGFTLFSRAYSRQTATIESIPLMLNRGISSRPSEYWDGRAVEGRVLERNDWFAKLHGLGYSLHVFQTDHLRYLRPRPGSELPVGDTLVEYKLETVRALDGTGLATGDKASAIMGIYVRMSWFLGMFSDAWAGLRQGPVGELLPLPHLVQMDHLAGSLSGMEELNELNSFLATVRPGQAVFAHILLPHSPYAFAPDCSLQPLGNGWLSVYDKRLLPIRNTEQTRAERYPLYLAQLQCTSRKLVELFATLDRAGVWDDAVVLVHGDHGSRLTLPYVSPGNSAEISDRDLVDSFGTLLAVKLPGERGRLDRRQVPIDDVFGQLCLDPEGTWPPVPYVPDPALLASPWVFLNDRLAVMERQPLPFFANGRYSDVLAE